MSRSLLEKNLEPEPLGENNTQQEPEPEPQKRCGSPAPQNTGKVRLVLR